MMQDVYNISRDTMENLLNRLRHPSYENAVLRESIMQRLHSEIQSTSDGNSETVQFSNLDLSFLASPQVNAPFSYSAVQISEAPSALDIPVKQIPRTEISYRNEYSPSTAA